MTTKAAPMEKKVVTTISHFKNKGEVLDVIYETLVDISLTLGYAFLGKKMGVSTPSMKLDMTDVAKLTAYFSAARATREMAVDKGWLPHTIG